MSDFMVAANVIGDLREQMAEKIGNDTPIDYAIENQTFDPDKFTASLGSFLDGYFDEATIDLSGQMIVTHQLIGPMQ